MTCHAVKVWVFIFTVQAKDGNTPPVDISEEKIGDVSVVSLIGRIEGVYVGQILAKLEALVETGCTALLIDLSEAEFISSTGLRALLVCDKKIKAAQGKIALCSPSEDIMEVLNITAMSEVFRIYETRIAALDNLI